LDTLHVLKNLTTCIEHTHQAKDSNSDFISFEIAKMLNL